MRNTKLQEHLDIFNSRFEKANDKIKSQVNYKSVNNIVQQLLKITTREENERFKDLMILYFQKVKDENYPTGVLFRDKVYNNYLLKVGNYLMKRKSFQSGSNLIVTIVFGLIIDSIIYYFTKNLISFYIPIVTILFAFLGIKSKRNAIKENRYFKKGF